MSDIDIRITGHAGRITLDRPKALNALTHDQASAIEAAIDAWRDAADVGVVVIDATGDKAFCAGGDITQLYHDARGGDLESSRRFWREEYRLNAKLATYPKPIVTFMQGFTMGGGVGIGCHASHRIVCESSRIAMPECGIGLVPDVGGSLLLARAPGRLGEYLGTTGHRMDAACAIHAGFADLYVPAEIWPDLIARLEGGADPEILAQAAVDPGDCALKQMARKIDAHFDAPHLCDTVARLSDEDSEFARETLKALRRASPLSATVAVDLIRDVRAAGTIERALEMEYRFTHRAVQHGDFLEGIRAAVIDKDRDPRWKHHSIEDVPRAEAEAMLEPIGAEEESPQ